MVYITHISDNFPRDGKVDEMHAVAHNKAVKCDLGR